MDWKRDIIIRAKIKPRLSKSLDELGFINTKLNALPKQAEVTCQDLLPGEEIGNVRSILKKHQTHNKEFKKISFADLANGNPLVDVVNVKSYRSFNKMNTFKKQKPDRCKCLYELCNIL
jgi:hypothetical protein